MESFVTDAEYRKNPLKRAWLPTAGLSGGRLRGERRSASVQFCSRGSVGRRNPSTRLPPAHGWV